MQGLDYHAASAKYATTKLTAPSSRFGLSTITTNTKLGTWSNANPAHPPTVDSIAEGYWSEQPQELGLHLHRNP
jgi:hypothetical protein